MKTMMRLAAISCVVFMTACEGNTTRDFVVENTSDEQLSVRVKPTMTGEWREKEVLEINGKTTIYSMDVMGGSDEPGKPAEYISEIEIISLSGDSLSSDQILQKIWDVETDHRKKVPSDYHHEFTVQITNDDLK